MFNANENSTDRWIRAIAGGVILWASCCYLSGQLRDIGYVIGVLMTITAITGFCMLYKISGISTIKKENKIK